MSEPLTERSLADLEGTVVGLVWEGVQLRSDFAEQCTPVVGMAGHLVVQWRSGAAGIVSVVLAGRSFINGRKLVHIYRGGWLQEPERTVIAEGVRTRYQFRGELVTVFRLVDVENALKGGAA